MPAFVPSGQAAAPSELDPAHADVIRATLPLVGGKIDDITRVFYDRMFTARPGLLRTLFNRGNQAQGAQQRALAASIATFAAHLVDPTLPHPAELLSRIGHKHASLGITADQYDIVHEHLFAAIVEVLGADTVTTEVAAAWDRVYWLMASTLIDLEHRLYAEAGVPDGQVFHRAAITSRVEDPSGTVIITATADAPVRHQHHPAQYVSVGITLPDGARQIRQYTVITGTGKEVTFAVKPVAGTDHGPAGEVSNHIATHLRPGDLIDITTAFGDLPTADLGTQPLVLISAGIGITPMIAILRYLHDTGSATAVQVLHADTSPATHPLSGEHRQLVEMLPHATLDLWYAEPGDSPQAHHGQLDLNEVSLPANASIFLCGNNGFVEHVREQLLNQQIDPARVHCELFSPNDWLLS